MASQFGGSDAAEDPHAAVRWARLGDIGRVPIELERVCVSSHTPPPWGHSERADLAAHEQGGRESEQCVAVGVVACVDLTLALFTVAPLRTLRAVPTLLWARYVALRHVARTVRIRPGAPD